MRTLGNACRRCESLARSVEDPGENPRYGVERIAAKSWTTSTASVSICKHVRLGFNQWIPDVGCEVVAERE